MRLLFKSLFTAGLCVPALCSVAQTAGGPVSNVQWQLSDVEPGLFQITYDLEPSPYNSYYRITLSAQLGNAPAPMTALSGDVGDGITPGIGKKVFWYSEKDIPDLKGNLVVTVVATRQYAPGDQDPCVLKSSRKEKLLFFGGALAGAGAIALGASLKSQSNQLYETYAAYLNPEDPVYGQTSRAEHYDKANQKHKTAVALLAGGGALVLGTGVYYLVNSLKARLAYRVCRESFSAAPAGRQSWNWAVVPTEGGLGLVLQF